MFLWTIVTLRGGLTGTAALINKCFMKYNYDEDAHTVKQLMPHDAVAIFIFICLFNLTKRQ